MIYRISTRWPLMFVLLTGGAILETPALGQHGGHHYGGHGFGHGFSGFSHHYYPSYYGGYYGAGYGAYGHDSWPQSYSPHVYVYSGTPTAYVDPQNNVAGNSYRPRTVATTTIAGTSYLRRAESAFRIHHYEEAIDWAKRAAKETPRDGRLFLLLSQIHLAVSEYGDAAGAARLGMSLLPKEDWGYVVKNFRSYYHDADYVAQIRRLERFIAENPNHAGAHFLLGYHWTFLGHPQAASRELTKAAELNAGDDWTNRLLQLVDSSAPRPQPPPTESVRSDHQIGDQIGKNELPQSVDASVEYAPPQQFDSPLKSSRSGPADHKHEKTSP